MSISFASVEGKDVSVIKVPRGTTPVYVGDGQHTKFYIRTGNTTQELTTKESIEYVRSHVGREAVMLKSLSMAVPEESRANATAL